jgi:hypothetical protein
MAAKYTVEPSPPAALSPECPPAPPPRPAATPWWSLGDSAGPHRPHAETWCAKPNNPWQRSSATIRSAASRLPAPGTRGETRRRLGAPTLAHSRILRNTMVEYTTLWRRSTAGPTAGIPSCAPLCIAREARRGLRRGRRLRSAPASPVGPCGPNPRGLSYRVSHPGARRASRPASSPRRLGRRSAWRCCRVGSRARRRADPRSSVSRSRRERCSRLTCAPWLRRRRCTIRPCPPRRQSPSAG